MPTQILPKTDFFAGFFLAKHFIWGGPETRIARILGANHSRQLIPLSVNGGATARSALRFGQDLEQAHKKVGCRSEDALAGGRFRSKTGELGGDGERWRLKGREQQSALVARQLAVGFQVREERPDPAVPAFSAQ